MNPKFHVIMSSYLLRITGETKEKLCFLFLHNKVRVNTIHICGPKTSWNTVEDEAIEANY